MFIDSASNCFWSCEVYKSCKRMFYDEVTNLWSWSRNVTYYVSRNTGFLAEFYEFVCNDRSVWRWFAADRVTGNNCRYDHSTKQWEWKVPWRNSHTYTERDVNAFCKFICRNQLFSFFQILDMHYIRIDKVKLFAKFSVSFSPVLSTFKDIPCIHDETVLDQKCCKSS